MDEYILTLDGYANTLAEKERRGKISFERMIFLLTKLDEWESEYYKKHEEGALT